MPKCCMIFRLRLFVTVTLGTGQPPHERLKYSMLCRPSLKSWTTCMHPEGSVYFYCPARVSDVILLLGPLYHNPSNSEFIQPRICSTMTNDRRWSISPRKFYLNPRSRYWRKMRRWRPWSACSTWFQKAENFGATTTSYILKHA